MKKYRGFFLYIVILLVLGFIIYIVPKVTGTLIRTDVITSGTLKFSVDAEGLVIRDDYIAISSKKSEISRVKNMGEKLRVGAKAVDIKKISKSNKKKVKYNNTDLNDYASDVKSRTFKTKTGKFKISGILSYDMDGYEKLCSLKAYKKIDYDTFEDMDFEKYSLKSKYVLAGTPIFRATDDKRWILLCFISNDSKGKKYYKKGESVTVEIDKKTMKGHIVDSKKGSDKYRIAIELTMTYPNFYKDRAVECKLTCMDYSGLIVKNSAICNKSKNVKGVYVKSPSGKFQFKEVEVLTTNGEKSVIESPLKTVKNYDEVMANPKEYQGDEI